MLVEMLVPVVCWHWLNVVVLVELVVQTVLVFPVLDTRVLIAGEIHNLVRSGMWGIIFV